MSGLRKEIKLHRVLYIFCIIIKLGFKIIIFVVTKWDRINGAARCTNVPLTLV